MKAKCDLALAYYWFFCEAGERKADAICNAIDLVANTWYEYAAIWNAVKGVI